MIWATVSSQSCFCWLYRASPSLVAKNTINVILVLTIWWCPCVESSLVLLEEGVCYDQWVLLAKLLAFALFHFVLQGQICQLVQVSLDFLLLRSSPLWWNGYLFLMTVQSFSIFGYKKYNQPGFSVDHPMISMCSLLLFCWKRVLLWPVCSLANTLC